jgi:hypothetical protein
VTARTRPSETQVPSPRGADRVSIAARGLHIAATAGLLFGCAGAAAAAERLTETDPAYSLDYVSPDPVARFVYPSDGLYERDNELVNGFVGDPPNHSAADLGRQDTYTEFVMTGGNTASGRARALANCEAFGAVAMRYATARRARGRPVTYICDAVAGATEPAIGAPDLSGDVRYFSGPFSYENAPHIAQAVNAGARTVLLRKLRIANVGELGVEGKVRNVRITLRHYSPTGNYRVASVHPLVRSGNSETRDDATVMELRAKTPRKGGCALALRVTVNDRAGRQERALVRLQRFPGLAC